MKRSVPLVWLAFAFLLPASCLQAQYNEKYRPQFHFSPKKGWIGDPDGLVFTDGKYHLFWWGHAVSEDLVHWKELPHPMKGDDGSFSYFSGSVVVDKENTAGFGEKSMIAVYTKHFRGDSLPETQALSVSNDGINFYYYENNPVLDIGKFFFRDPQVFWYAPEQKWVMVVSLPDIQKIHIYESKNMKDWKYLSEFGSLGAQNSFWECPDLFELPVDGDTTNKKWVMLIGRGPNRVQYFIGDFDGKEFRADEATAAYLVDGKGLKGNLFAGFDETSYGKWKSSGTAFGNAPTTPDSVGHHLRRGYASSLQKTKAKGTLTSPTFKITQRAINFLVAGGNHPGKTCINLLVDGKVVRTTTGDNSAVLKWNGWDVQDLKGKKATIKIIDDDDGDDWGYIAVDHLLFSDVLQNQELEHALWLDYGPDFYAARTWRDVDQVSARTTMLGWMGNWDYARDVPTTWGKGFESVPREIAIKSFAEGNRIVQKPVPELQKLRKEVYQFSDKSITGTEKVSAFSPAKNVYELDVVFDTRSSATFGLNLLAGNNRKLIVSYDPTTSNLSVDRTQCTYFTSNPDFNKAFATKMHAVVEPENNQLRLHILVDQSSVEIFTNQGKVVLSALTFPGEQQTGIELFSKNGNARLVEFKAWELTSIWKEHEN
ncbi:glycoside hydrolase family 32 protein [Pontibacter qinzhouensis]|uniref:Glycoside hydrolase family 32 protein n=1 Tax=Pontibacter qinzhouensis TaxID=2603253 RepID=A0A5C8K8K3_9BACT|nr:glycoside hydrolase family 32 protein [Pontibacter qinzhouensis]TXK46095.1 glycoside hydrolase family 32 protein [Pontibacter qinzhouensis]